jgi:2-C-methyl-D-erythritol 4-phosphate cytidylyltransferase
LISNKIHVVILAAGNGKRIDDSLPKQFHKINGKPLLFHTFEAFSFLNEAVFYLVLHDNYVEYWNDLVRKLGFAIPHKIVSGGPTRFHSVKSSLNNIPDNEIVLLHDGVRPLVSRKTINNVIEVTGKKGNAIPVVNISESIREVDGVFSKGIDRSKIKTVQTPQGFISSDIKNAYSVVYKESYTDDASVFEESGGKVNLVEGNIENIKVTMPMDLKIAELYLSKGH